MCNIYNFLINRTLSNTEDKTHHTCCFDFGTALLSTFKILKFLGLERTKILKDPSQARLCYCFDLKFAIKLLVERA